MISDQSCSDNVIQGRSYARTPLMDMYTCLVQRVSTWSSRSDIPTWGLPDNRAVCSRIRTQFADHVWRNPCNLPNTMFGGAVTTRCDGNCQRLRKSEPRLVTEKLDTASHRHPRMKHLSPLATTQHLITIPHYPRSPPKTAVAPADLIG
jgi:hypothetical protein